jgi:hypothetical protein
MAQKSVESYLEYIGKYPEPDIKFPKIGKIYIFAYLFNQTINQQKSYNALKDEGEIKFYDFLPAVFIWQINMATYSFYGLNLHNIPINARKRWIDILQRYAGDEKPDPKKFLPLKRLLESASGMMKHYTMRKVRKLKEVPTSMWLELMQFDVNTTFRATSGEITAKYLSLIK